MDIERDWEGGLQNAPLWRIVGGGSGGRISSGPFEGLTCGVLPNTKRTGYSIVSTPPRNPSLQLQLVIHTPHHPGRYVHLPLQHLPLHNPPILPQLHHPPTNPRTKQSTHGSIKPLGGEMCSSAPPANQPSGCYTPRSTGTGGVGRRAGAGGTSIRDIKRQKAKMARRRSPRRDWGYGGFLWSGGEGQRGGGYASEEGDHVYAV